MEGWNYTYLMLGRLEDTPEWLQPEEQHGFRRNRRLEEHLLQTNMFVDKTTHVEVRVWIIITFDLSKTFDRMHWPALWNALRDQGTSHHLPWILPKMYENQRGQVMGKPGVSTRFPISAGVRQGGALSPRLFLAVMQEAKCCWRLEMSQEHGFDLGDGSVWLATFGLQTIYCCLLHPNKRYVSLSSPWWQMSNQLG